MRAGAHHEAHVVLDEQHAEAVGGERTEQRAELGGLALVQTGRRLVEQEQPRLRRERAGHLDQARGAGGQRVDALAGDVAETDLLDDLVGHDARASNRRATSPRRISAATSTLSRTDSVPKVSSRWKVRPMPEAGPLGAVGRS